MAQKKQGAKNKPPERIYGWQDGYLSVARFYGGIVFEGHRYTVAATEKGTPLVREDVLRREAVAKKKPKAEGAPIEQLGLW